MATAAAMKEQLRLPRRCKYSCHASKTAVATSGATAVAVLTQNAFAMNLPTTTMRTGYYAGGNPANVSWQASETAGGARHFGVTDHTRRSNATQQGKGKN